MSSTFNDEFNASAIDSRWTFVNPAGDCTVTATGTHARVAIPGGTHDQYSNNRDAPKLVQAVDGDFDARVKFDDIPTGDIDGWGVYADEGPGGNWLKWLIQQTDRTICTTTSGGPSNLTNRYDDRVYGGAGGSVYLRLTRTAQLVGDPELAVYTGDGSNWTQRASFTWSASLSRVGVLAIEVFDTVTQVDVDWFHDATISAAPEEHTGTGQPLNLTTAYEVGSGDGAVGGDGAALRLGLAYGTGQGTGGQTASGAGQPMRLGLAYGAGAGAATVAAGGVALDLVLSYGTGRSRPPRDITISVSEPETGWSATGQVSHWTAAAPTTRWVTTEPTRTTP